MIKKSYISFLLLIPLAFACQLDPLPQDELPSFNKLYAVSENVEAIDFICKPDQDGYIILGNYKSSENSDIFLIDVSSDGFQRSFNRIKTSFFDEAIKMKVDETDNSLIILGHRRLESAQTNVYQNILLKTNIDGVPIKADNALEEDSTSAEIKVITDNQSSPYQLNDFVLIPPYLVTVGNIRQSPTGAFNEVTRIYDWASFNFSDTSDASIILIRQKPAAIPFNNSENLRVFAGNSQSTVYSIIGQNNTDNVNGEATTPSDNITWNIYTDIQSNSSEPIFIGTDKNEEFGNILQHSTGKTYIGGSYIDSEEDSLFLITKDYTGSNNNKNQKIFSFAGYGTKITGIAEDIDHNIIIATIEEENLNNISYLLRFSPAGSPIEIENEETEENEIENIVFPSTGFYNIKKIESEPNNVVVILSQKTFENNSTAIGLMKIKF